MGTAVPASKDGSSHTPASFPSEDRAETAARERIAGGLLSGSRIPVRGVDTVTAAAPWPCIASKPRPFTECGRRYANPTEPRTSRGDISRGAAPFSLLFNPLERCRFSAAGADRQPMRHRSQFSTGSRKHAAGGRPPFPAAGCDIVKIACCRQGCRMLIRWAGGRQTPKRCAAKARNRIQAGPISAEFSTLTRG
jgi:hypothetical protein